MPSITIALSDDIVDSARLPPKELEGELRKELAVALYSRQILSAAKARKLAELTVWEFFRLVASHGLTRHYDE